MVDVVNVTEEIIALVDLVTEPNPQVNVISTPTVNYVNVTQDDVALLGITTEATSIVEVVATGPQGAQGSIGPAGNDAAFLNGVAISSAGVTDGQVLVYRTSSNSWVVASWLDVIGRKNVKVVTGVISTTTTIIAAVSGKRLKVQSYAIFSDSTSKIVVTFKSGANGTALWAIPLHAQTHSVFGANLSTQYPAFIFGTLAGEALELSLDGPYPIQYSIAYWDDDVT